MPPTEQIPDGTTFEKEFEKAGSWFAGTVSSFDEDTMQYRVDYDDGDLEDMTRTTLEWWIAKTIKRQQTAKPRTLAPMLRTKPEEPPPKVQKAKVKAKKDAADSDEECDEEQEEDEEEQ